MPRMKIISGGQTGVDRIADWIRSFVAGDSIATLNMAGPRASDSPLAYAYALQAMDCFLKDYAEK